MTWRHGTEFAYRQKGCRCDACQAAHARELEVARARKERHRGRCEQCGAATAWRGGAGRPLASPFCLPCSVAKRAAPEHGQTAYKRGCRCDVCRATHAAYQRAWLARAVA